MPDDSFPNRPADPWAPPSTPPVADPWYAPPGSAWAPPGAAAPGPSGPPPAPGWGPPPGSPPPPGPYGAPGRPPAGPPAPAPTPKRGAGLAVTLGVLGGCLVVALIAVTVIVFSIRSGPSHPDTWDSRVDFAVKFVEQQKGKPFKHPVQVDFLPVEEFERDVSAADEETTAEDRTEADQQAAALRILGLVEGEVDLLDQTRTLVSKGAAAYYSPSSEEVKVRGTTIDLYTQATIVHELTHAWQDQYYDLGQLATLDDEAAQALRALVEGDASNVEEAWVQTLNGSDAAEYDRQEQAMGEEAGKGVSNVPDVMVTSFGAPYEIGPFFLQGLDASGGDRAVDDVFADPPKALATILEPWRYQDGNPAPLQVEPPAGPSGAEVVDEGTNGALLLYVMLADRIDPHDALAASDAWAGDAYELTDQGGTVCMTARIAAEGGGRRALQDAVRDWADGLPHLRVEDDGDGVTFEGCDPGEAADLDVPGRSRQTIVLPVLRIAVWSQELRQGTDGTRAECLGNAVVDELGEDELADLSAELVAELRGEAELRCP